MTAGMIVGSRTFSGVERPQWVPDSVKAKAVTFVEQVRRLIPGDAAVVGKHEKTSFKPVSGLDLDHALVVKADTPDRAQSGATLGTHFDMEKALTSWSEFPAFLQTVKAQQDKTGQHVVLNLETHGNHGSGFLLNPPSGPLSIASAAWVLQQIESAGFTPEQITIVAEACNAGTSYKTTHDGMDAGERRLTLDKASAHMEHGAAVFDLVEEGQPAGKLSAATVADLGRYRVIGRVMGANQSSVLLQVVSGIGVKGEAVPGAVLQKLQTGGVRIPSLATVAVISDPANWPTQAPVDNLAHWGPGWLPPGHQARTEYDVMVHALHDKAPRLVDIQAYEKAASDSLARRMAKNTEPGPSGALPDRDAAAKTKLSGMPPSKPSPPAPPVTVPAVDKPTASPIGTKQLVPGFRTTNPNVPIPHGSGQLRQFHFVVRADRQGYDLQVDGRPATRADIDAALKDVQHALATKARLPEGVTMNGDGDVGYVTPEYAQIVTALLLNAHPAP